MSDEEKALDNLNKLSQQMEESRIQYEAENDAWWDGLTEKEREDAFYAVVKRIHKAEIKDQGSYRYALYDVFGFDMNMYMSGMNCGFLDLHNSIIDEDQKATLRKYSRMEKVNRFEVIGPEGREYVRYFKDEEFIMNYGLQDDDRTLKVFIEDGNKSLYEDCSDGEE